MKKETFEKKLKIGIVEYTVQMIDKDYGCFEFYDIDTGGERLYAEGGLWFDGKELVDYDGVFQLPLPVIDKLKEWGYNTEFAND